MKKMLLSLIKVLVLFGGMSGVLIADPIIFNGSTGLELTDGDAVLINSGIVSLEGDRVISLSGSSAHATLMIGSTIDSGSVTLQPAENADAILLFDVISADSVLEVQLLNSLDVVGNGNKPMFIGVRGKGEVRIRIPFGKNITFRSASPTTAGAHVRILMEQNKAQMEASSQLSFVSWGVDEDDVNTDSTLHSVIEIGQNSSISFISQHKSGLVDPEDVLDYGYGSIAFDPSNNSTGRMIVKIASGATAVDFKDGALMIYGSYVEGSGISDTDVLTSDFRTNVVYKYRAGVAATLRIIDSVARGEVTSGNLNTYMRTSSNSRGLVVLNYNNSFPRLANNYDQMLAVALPEDFESDGLLTDSKWFQANTVQNGFVLGNNGIIEIENNRFLDYFACRTNASNANFPKDGVHVPTGSTDEDGLHINSQVKKHNPSALIVDGNAFRKTGTTAAADPNFEYDAHDIARIILRGNAGVFARVAADNVSGLVGPLTIGSNCSRAYDLSNAHIDGTIDRATYDGKAIIMRDEDNNIVPEISELGEIAIDVEGPLHILSTSSGDDRVAANGFINMPTILISYRGKEMARVGTSCISHELVEVTGRPLPLDDSLEYFRYNNSCLLVNDFIRFENTRLVHNDLGRDVTDIGTGYAIPAVIGGELPSLRIAAQIRDAALDYGDGDTWILSYSGSPIYLENSTIECHESLVSAGVHWVVRDREIENDDITTGDNFSRLVLYSRGHEQDLDITGMGRFFQLGSRLNTMADGGTINPLTLNDGTYPVSSLRDAFLNVYRQRPIPEELNPEQSEYNIIKFTIETEFEAGVTSAEKSIHLIHLSDRSTIDLGWNVAQYQFEDAVYVEADSRYAPWEYSVDVLNALRDQDPNNEGGYRFAPHAYGRGILSFDGNTVCLSGAGRYNAAGVLAPSENELSPRGVRDGGGILYINFGGELRASNSHDLILNTVIGRKTSVVDAAAGLLSVDADQLIFQPAGKVETFGFDVAANPNPSLVNLSNPSIVSINVSELPTPDVFRPIKGFDRNASYHWPYDSKRFISRSTESVTGPVQVPDSGMLVMTSGNAIDQVQVFGATRANPFHLRLTGDSTGFSRVREFVNVASDPAILGEGPHAALFLDHGARIGLGSRSWNVHSVNAWNQLGLDKVSLFPNGNGVVDLNSDIIITDKLPIIATENFGRGAAPHQLIFYSPVPREIRLTAGSELDLSSFGRCDGVAYQQIVFSGHVRLVIEPGAKIRFPSTVTSNNNCAPVLYFNDHSQCIFVSNEHADVARYTDSLTGADKIRAKILGIGQIWLNKEAQLTIFDNAQLGVEADRDTPETDVTISIQRNARMLIGDESRAGGAFQVGNVVDGGGDGTNARDSEDAVLTNISFTLKLNGEKANFHIDRSGFFGIAAGVVNKTGNPNGAIENATTNPEDDEEQFGAWRVQSLRNVKNITLDITRGYFDHNQIYDGSAAQAFGSVLALGALDYNADNELDDLNGGRYTLQFGLPSEAFVRGGGNVVFVDAGIPHTDPLALSIWNVSADIALEGSNSGKYTIMAPSPMIRTYIEPLGLETIDVVLDANNSQQSYIFRSRLVNDVNSQGGALYEMYSTFTMPIYGGWRSKIVAAGKNSRGGVTAAYLRKLSGNDVVSIIRAPQLSAIDRGTGTSVDPKGALDKAYFIGTTSYGQSVNGYPETLAIP